MEKQTKTVYLTTVSFKGQPDEIGSKVHDSVESVKRQAKYYEDTNSLFRITGYIPVQVTY